MAWPAALKRARRGIATLTPIKPSPIRFKKPIVSFTFDDAPKSAWNTAGEILSRYGVLATYYLAGDLLGKSHPRLGPFCDTDDGHSLIEDGHEVGCHTFSHLDCQTASRVEIERDMADNRRMLAEQFNQTPTSFAYPYGIVTLGAKRAASAQYACARGTRSGINRYIADLAQLRTISLYSDLTLHTARRLIDATCRSCGWLIFYTHDVQQQPSPFGCTPDQFEEVVKMAHLSGCDVLPIRSALSAVYSNGEDAAP